MPVEVEETRLPGIGSKFTLRLDAGGRLAVILHNDGKRELYYFRHAGDEEPQAVITLDDDEARRLGAVVGGAYELLLGPSPFLLQPARLGLGVSELLSQLLDSAPRRGGSRLERAQLSLQVADPAARLARRRSLGRARRTGRHVQPRERLEARRLELLGEPAALEQRAAVLGQRPGAKRREHPVEGGAAAAGGGEDLRRTRCEGFERVLLVPTGLEERVSALGADGLALGSFRLLAGEELVREYAPEDGWPKCFCSVCGSALWSKYPDTGEVGSVRLGLFDPGHDIRPQWRTFVDYACEWEPIPDDGLERYPEGKPR